MVKEDSERKAATEKLLSNAKVAVKASQERRKSKQKSVISLQEELRRLQESLNSAVKEGHCGESKIDRGGVDGDGDLVERCRTLSDADVAAAEAELDKVVQEIESNADLTARSLKRQQLLTLIGVLVVVLLSPGALLTLKEAEMVQIRDNTTLSSIVSGWESGFTCTRGWLARAAMTAVNHTVCHFAPPPPLPPPYAFTHRHPPLMRDGHMEERAGEALWGEGTVQVCANGTAELSFLRRDDCDGCLCPTGSVWLQYNDPRFFGNGEHCVKESQWNACINSWLCCKHKPNFCWEFIWNGGRQDPTEPKYKVIVDSCSLHGGCHAMIRRFRRWELILDRFSCPLTPLLHTRMVGVHSEDISRAERSLHMAREVRGWGLPSSVQFLLKLGPHSSPEEWLPMHAVEYREQFNGERVRLWQLVSRYEVVVTDLVGVEHEITRWTQREWLLYTDTL